jgi:cyclopropane fatty-acyl-phospholipid synthase-like methyltransferase
MPTRGEAIDGVVRANPLLGQTTDEAARRPGDWRAVRRQAAQAAPLNGVLAELDLDPTHILDAGTEDATFATARGHFPTANMTAVDIDATGINACRAARPSAYAERIQFLVCDFESLSPTAFDLIVAFDALEHIDDDLAAFANLAQAFRLDGTLLVTCRVIGGRLATARRSVFRTRRPGESVPDAYARDTAPNGLKRC